MAGCHRTSSAFANDLDTPEHPRPLWAPGVRGETILRYKVNGSADITEIALVRASQR